MSLSFPSLGFIVKVAITLFIISMAMKMFPQLRQVAGGITV